MRLLNDCWHLVPSLTISIMFYGSSSAEAVGSAAAAAIGVSIILNSTGNKVQAGNPAPQEVADEIPSDWGAGRPFKEGKGWGWPAPGKAGKNGDGVRWTPSAPNSPGENARGDNVKVVSGGRRLTQSGIPSDSSNPNKEIILIYPRKNGKDGKIGTQDDKS